MPRPRRPSRCLKVSGLVQSLSVDSCVFSLQGFGCKPCVPSWHRTHACWAHCVLSCSCQQSEALHGSLCEDHETRGHPEASKSQADGLLHRTKNMLSHAPSARGLCSYPALRARAKTAKRGCNIRNVRSRAAAAESQLVADHQHTQAP